MQISLRNRYNRDRQNKRIHRNFTKQICRKNIHKKRNTYCESKRNAKYQHYAARFAAKEAVFKAISNIIENKYSIDWKNIEVLNDTNGRPKINFINTQIKEPKQCDISISHCKKYAVANVVCIFQKNY